MVWGIPLTPWMRQRQISITRQLNLSGGVFSYVNDYQLGLIDDLTCNRPILSSLFLLRPFLPYLVRIGSSSFRRRIWGLVPLKSFQKATEIIDLMHAESVTVYKSRMSTLMEGEEAVVHQIGKGKDILSILRE